MFHLIHFPPAFFESFNLLHSFGFNIHSCDLFTSMYNAIYTHRYIYIYIYGEREREKETLTSGFEIRHFLNLYIYVCLWTIFFLMFFHNSSIQAFSFLIIHLSDHISFCHISFIQILFIFLFFLFFDNSPIPSGFFFFLCLILKTFNFFFFFLIIHLSGHLSNFLYLFIYPVSFSFFYSLLIHLPRNF